MPQLPEFRAPFDVQPDTPAAADVAPWRAGATGGAVEAVGAGLADISVKIMAAQKQADDSDAVTEKHKTYLLDLQNVEREARIKAETTGMKGYATEMAAWIDQRAKDDQETLPSDEARRAYISSVGSMMTKHVMEARQTEMAGRLAAFNLSTTKNAEALGIVAMKGPSMVDGKYRVDTYLREQADMLTAMLGDVEAKTGLFGENAAAANRAKLHQETSLGVAEGLFQTGQYEPLMKLLLGTYGEKERGVVEKELHNSFYLAQIDAAYETGALSKEKYDQVKADIASGKISAKSVVKVPKDVELAFAERDVSSEFLMKGMPHEKRFEFIQRINSALKERGYKDMSDHKRRFADYKAMGLEKGGTPPAAMFAEVDAYAKSMNGRPPIYTAETAAALKDELRVAYAAGNAINRLKMVPFADHERSIKGFAPALPGIAGENAQERLRAEHYVRAGSERIMNEFRQDPASFYRSVSPEVARLEKQAQNTPAHWQDILGRREAYQKRMLGGRSMGVRLLDNNERDRLVGLLQSETDPGKGISAIAQEIQKYGRYAPRVDEEVKASKGVADEYAAIFDQTDNQARDLHVVNLKNRKDIEKAMEAVEPDIQKELKTAISQEIVNIRPSFVNGLGLKGFNGVSTLMRLDAEALVAGKGYSPNEAVKVAKERMMETYHFSTAGGSNVAFHKNLRGYGPTNIQRAEEVMNWHKANRENVMRAIQFGAIKTFDAGLPPGATQQQKNEATADVVANSARWLPGPGYDTLMLGYQDARGAWVFIRDQQGNPFTIDLRKISSGQIPAYMDPNAKVPVYKKPVAPATEPKKKRRPASAVTEQTPDVEPSDELEGVM
jgi:hypothetical protein